MRCHSHFENESLGDGGGGGGGGMVGQSFLSLSNVSSCGALRCYQLLSLESPGMTACKLLVGTLVCLVEDEMVYGARVDEGMFVLVRSQKREVLSPNPPLRSCVVWYIYLLEF